MNTTLPSLLPRLRLQRGMTFGFIIIAALVFFELFNFSTTDFALHDLLGDLAFLGLPWSTILAIAFCGIDFAGIARIFTPEDGAAEPAEVWYLFGAWLLAAFMNAILTWWGISIALLNTHTLGNAIVPRDSLLKFVPIFVAILVLLSRVMLIGTFSVAGHRLFSQADSRPPRRSSGWGPFRPASPDLTAPSAGFSRPAPKPSFAPMPKSGSIAEERPSSVRTEPTYHSISLDGHSRPANQFRQDRR